VSPIRSIHYVYLQRGWMCAKLEELTEACLTVRHRLVTRSDFDGLVSAALLKELGMINEIQFVHPKDMQDGKVAMRPGDITTNLPYVDGCYLVFDHHESETVRLGAKRPDNHIINPKAPSAARVVYEYFGGVTKFHRISLDLMEAVDKSDSARFTREEILKPEGWVLLNFLMDARTGLGRFKNFRISNYQLMMQLIEACREKPIERLLAMPDVKERADLYFEHSEKFAAQIRRCARVHDDLVVLDLRNEETIYAGNRFMVYALYPQCNISMHIMWGLQKQNTVFAIGKSILTRTSSVNIAELCLGYGGGGHINAGTCQIENHRADAVAPQLIDRITKSSKVNDFRLEPALVE
jgi:nanoRNase/pAp phosphatase (c-di-AMP/oligoRNAs hydrolase)